MLIKSKLILNLKATNVIFNKSCIFIHVSSNRRAKNYYDVLNIKRNATRKEIKMAFYKLSKEYHPDINEKHDAEENFKAIQEAYQILGDEKRKNEYDLTLDDAFSHNIPGVMNNPAWRKRTGPYTGQTSAYDFDEHYRAHYAKQKQGGFNTSGSTYSSYSKREQATSFNEDDLKNYWNRKEFTSNSQKTEMLSFLSRFVFIFTLLFALGAFFQRKKNQEIESGLQAYRRNLNENKSFNSEIKS